MSSNKNPLRKYLNQSSTDEEEDFQDEQISEHSDQQDDDKSNSETMEAESEAMDTESEEDTVPSASENVKQSTYRLTLEQKVWIIGQCFNHLLLYKLFKIQKMRNDFKKKFGTKYSQPDTKTIHRLVKLIKLIKLLLFIKF